VARDFLVLANCNYIYSTPGQSDHLRIEQNPTDSQEIEEAQLTFALLSRRSRRRSRRLSSAATKTARAFFLSPLLSLRKLGETIKELKTRK
jgi:hypothetical protein